jgi:hypothetical protein
MGIVFQSRRFTKIAVIGGGMTAPSRHESSFAPRVHRLIIRKINSGCARAFLHLHPELFVFSRMFGRSFGTSRPIDPFCGSFPKMFRPFRIPRFLHQHSRQVAFSGTRRAAKIQVNHLGYRSQTWAKSVMSDQAALYFTL